MCVSYCGGVWCKCRLIKKKLFCCKMTSSSVWKDLDLDLDKELGLQPHSISLSPQRTRSTLHSQEGSHGFFHRLVRLWVNERASPEILSYDYATVSEAQRVIKTQQDCIDQADIDTVDREESSMKLVRDLMQLDVDRLQFILTSYLRTRLLKIEQHVMYILLHQDYVERLSEHEAKFASNYVDLLAEHFHTSLLDLIPERFRELDDDSDEAKMSIPNYYCCILKYLNLLYLVPAPNKESFVFIKVLEDVGEFRYG